MYGHPLASVGKLVTPVDPKEGLQTNLLVDKAQKNWTGMAAGRKTNIPSWWANIVLYCGVIICLLGIWWCCTHIHASTFLFLFKQMSDWYMFFFSSRFCCFRVLNSGFLENVPRGKLKSRFQWVYILYVICQYVKWLRDSVTDLPWAGVSILGDPAGAPTTF